MKSTHKEPLRSVLIRQEFEELAGEMHRIAEFCENEAVNASTGELIGVKIRGSLTAIKIRLGQIRYHLHINK